MRSSLTPIHLPRSLLALALAIAAPASLLSGSLPFGTWDSWANPSDLALRPVAVESVVAESELAGSEKERSEVARPTTARRFDRPSSYVWGTDHVAKALHRWHRAYRGGDIKLDDLARRNGKTKNLYGQRVLPRHEPANLTHEQALSYLLAAARKTQTVKATKEVLLLAAVGLTEEGVNFESAPYVVRAMAQKTLAQIVDVSSQLLIFNVAVGKREDETTGVRRLWKKGEYNLAVRAAAIRGLGSIGRASFRNNIEQNLAQPEAILRMAAAESLLTLNHASSIDALTAAMNTEADSTIAQVLLEVVAKLLTERRDTIGAGSSRRVVATCIDMLGRIDWQTDIAIVDLLARFRSTMSIEPLINLLDRYETNKKATDKKRVIVKIDSGKFSGLLRHRAFDVLVAHTGALIEIDDIAGWRTFWAKEKGNFKLPPPPKKADEARRTVAGFFGIPIIGTRVVFVIDVSGSMALASQIEGMATATGPRPKYVPTRFALAKKELIAAVRRLPGDARFNVIFFADKVDQWRTKLSDANDKNKTALETWIDTLHPDGGTNLYGGVERALSLKHAVHGKRYDVNVDEIFLLSDGEPSIGKIILPERIRGVVRETNRFSKVRINTVFLGTSGGSVFMKNLAEDNHGKYVQH